MENTKNAGYDFMLNFFVSVCPTAESLKYIHYDEKTGYVYATNTHFLIKVPIANLQNTYKPRYKFPNAEKIFKSCVNFKEVGNISTESLVSALACFNWYRERESNTCPDCIGEGKKECDACNHSHTCDNCNGMGVVQKGVIPLSLLISEDFESRIKIGNSHLKLDYIQIITILAALVHADTINVRQGTNENDATVLKVGVAEIIIMPMMKDVSDKFIEVNFN